MIITETIIWAAVFAKNLNFDAMPAFDDDTKGPYWQQRREWQKKHTQICCDRATEAIEALRTFKEETIDQYGHHPVSAHYAQMVGNEK